MAAPASNARTSTAPDDSSDPVLPDVQKAFWLRGDLAVRYNEMLVARRVRNPKTRERELLNEAVELLLAKARA